MHSYHRATLILAAVCLLGVVGPVLAQLPSYNGNLQMGSHEHFTLQLIDPTGLGVPLTEADKYADEAAVNGVHSGRRWKIQIPGTNPARDVWVDAYRNSVKSRFFITYRFPTGIPPGWRVDFLEQRFDVAFTNPPQFGDLQVAIPIVYGPTFYTVFDILARPDTRVDSLYPTFLQTQQVTLLNTVTGDCMSIATDDDRALRKHLGVKVDFTGAIQFIARYIPEHGLVDPNPNGWTLPYQIQFGFFSGGIGDAIDWYRKEQLKRPTSFLRSRTPASLTMHPAIRACKFVIGVGASYSPDLLPHGQSDVTAQYRQDVLNYFTAVHGDNMLLYHLGWAMESPYNAPPGHPLHDGILELIQLVLPPTAFVPQIFPDEYRTITPGHAALLAESKAMNRNVRSVSYALPAILTPFSTDYAGDLAKLNADGTASVVDFLRPEGEHDDLCWYRSETVDVYTSLVANTVLGQHGFDGIYLDALSAAPVCYGHVDHGHPLGWNEQLVGIDRMLYGIRSAFPRGPNLPPMLINETPTDSLRTDGCAIDYNALDANYRNLFTMTYDGEEWPRFAVVYGFNYFTYGPSGVEYLIQLASALASGVRPLILWPEYRLPPPLSGLPQFQGLGFPTSPTAVNPAVEPAFPFFLNLLNSYSYNFDSFWRDIMLGRRLEPLNPFDIVSDSVYNPAPPPQYTGDPVTDRWRIPGWRPRLNGVGSYPLRLSDRATPAVFHGLFEPKNNPGRRCLVMVRWTDPSMAATLPPNHPAGKKIEKVTLRLSAKNTKARPGGLVRLFDVKSKSWKNLGNLPINPGQKTGPIEVDFDSMGAKVVVID